MTRRFREIGSLPDVMNSSRVKWLKEIGDGNNGQTNFCPTCKQERPIQDFQASYTKYQRPVYLKSCESCRQKARDAARKADKAEIANSILSIERRRAEIRSMQRTSAYRLKGRK